MARTPAARSRKVDARVELGETGLKQFGGIVREEFLRSLQGRQGARIYAEMRDNDPTVGALLFVVEQLARQVSWSVEPEEETPEDVEAAEFVQSNLNDMEMTWEDTLAEIFSMLTFGWSYHEIVYKLRVGPDEADLSRRSRFDDGKLGWRKLPIRGQETLLSWVFDDKGDLLGLEQLGVTSSKVVFIPVAKALLFRTTSRKNNPEGRALDPETLIPTPDGWKLLDDFQPGDKVFDERGMIRYVVERADWEDRPCYRVVFSGGDEIIADAKHQWLTRTLYERSNGHGGRLRSTEEIASTVKNSRGASDHSVGWAEPLDYPEQVLIVDPYVLGLWLGDGSSSVGNIACHVDDVEEEQVLVEACGYQTSVVQNGVPDCNGRMLRVYGSQRWAKDGLAHGLRVLGLINNKHVPEAYLRGSVAQRHALLAGLMDSDGHVDRWGRCEFSNTNLDLANAVAELVRSLGVGAALRWKRDRTWTVRFTPSWSPFRLKRKADRTINARARQQHYVTSVEPVSRRRTVCLEVDAPSNLFLAGVNMVPTHNSILRNAYRPWFFKKRLEEVEAIGIERDLAGLPMARVPSSIMQSTAPANQKAIYDEIKRIVKNVRNDEQAGIVIPSDTDADGNKLYEFELLSTGGRRAVEPGAPIERYARWILMTALADFVILGHERVGSFALADNKTDIFAVALSGLLDSVTATYNNQGIPRLLSLNGMRGRAKLVHGDVETIDAGKLFAALKDAALAGFEFSDLENDFRRRLGWPESTLDDVDEDDGSDAGARRREQDDDEDELEISQ